MNVRGVANVAVCGQRKRSMQVEIDPDTLRENGAYPRSGHEATADALD